VIFTQTQTPFHDYQFIRIGLTIEREALYKKIETRVDKMIENGLQEEVERLRKKYPPDCPPFKSVGYKEILMYLEGKINFTGAVALIKQHTRNFAKRQLSWFRQEKDIHWFHPLEFSKIEAFVRERI
jgi:tRNA dimethylallyltransferase